MLTCQRFNLSNLDLKRLLLLLMLPSSFSAITIPLEVTTYVHTEN